jgi:hypothetical protein
MLVSELIGLAKNSELKQLSISDDDIAVLGYINLGILELHKRFNLVQKEAVITMVEDVFSYRLDGTDNNVEMDTANTELLTIDNVYDYNGCQLRINDEDDRFSVTTPEYNLLEVPVTTVLDGATLSVIYRASPKFITQTNSAVPLPLQFIEALLHYVGYRAHNSINGEVNTENNTHYMRFDKSCKLIRREGLYTEDSLSTHKFEDRGFV